MGDDNSTREISMDMKIKAISPNLSGNVGLFNQLNIQLRQISGVFSFILKNHLIHSTYRSLITKRNVYLYKDEVSGWKIACGIIFLKI